MKKPIFASTCPGGPADPQRLSSSREHRTSIASMGGNGPAQGSPRSDELPNPWLSNHPAAEDATLKQFGTSAAQTTSPDSAVERKKRCPGFVLVILIVLLMVFCLAVPAAAFEYESIGYVFGGYRDIDLDFSGQAHVSHVLCDVDDLVLAYSTNVSGTWETEFIATDVDGLCWGTAIVAQSPSVVHIVYGRQSLEDRDFVFQLVHITNASGVWLSSIIDEHVEANFEKYMGGGRFAGRPSLAIGTDGNLHLSYCDDYYLMYARTFGDSWRVATLVRDEWATQFHSLALDSRNRPHICYSRYDEIRHLYKRSRSWRSVWRSELVEHPADDDPVAEESARIEDLDMAIDGKDRIHLSYYIAQLEVRGAPQLSQLKYAFKEDSGWTTEIIDFGVGRSNKIGVDIAGKAHIAFYSPLEWTGSHFEDKVLYYTNKNGYWKETFVDRSLNRDAIAQMGILLEMDMLCRPHIFYGDDGAFYKEDPFDDILDRMDVMHAYLPGMCPLVMHEIRLPVGTPPMRSARAQ